MWLAITSTRNLSVFPLKIPSVELVWPKNPMKGNILVLPGSMVVPVHHSRRVGKKENDAKLCIESCCFFHLRTCFLDYCSSYDVKPSDCGKEGFGPGHLGVRPLMMRVGCFDLRTWQWLAYRGWFLWNGIRVNVGVYCSLDVLYLSFNALSVPGWDFQVPLDRKSTR